MPNPLFTRQQVLAMKSALKLTSPQSVFGKDWYKWFGLNDNGRVDFIEISNTSFVNVGAGATVNATYDTVIKDQDGMLYSTTKILIKNSGLYGCFARADLDAVATTVPSRTVSVQTDESVGATFIAQVYPDPGASVKGQQVFNIAYLTAGQLVEVELTNLDSAAKNIRLTSMKLARLA